MDDALKAHMVRVAALMDRLVEIYAQAQPNLITWQILRTEAERDLRQALGEDE